METKQSAIEIRDESDVQSLTLCLYVEGHKVAKATASAEALQDIHLYLGRSREDVHADLEKALRDYLHATLEQVRIEGIMEDPQQNLMFRATYIFQDGNLLRTGIVWYDIIAESTGPEEVSTLVRHKMRTGVHKKLVKKGSIAEEIIDIVTSDSVK